MDDARAKDLDETRRLCYMALAYHRTDGYELAGTLVNALLHHQQVDEPVGVVMDRVIGAVSGLDDGLEWVESQLDRVNDALAAQR